MGGWPPIRGGQDLSDHIYSFYKELFTEGPRTGVALATHFWPLGALVSDDENSELTLPFSPEEVRRAIMGMKANSAPGPDGLPVSFFQKFWEYIEAVIMPMFQEFYSGTLVLSRLNFGVITLIPTVVGATDVRQFRPITVINVSARQSVCYTLGTNCGAPGSSTSVRLSQGTIYP